MGHKKEALRGLCAVCAAVGLSALLSGHCVLSGCRAAVSPVTLGPDSDGTPLGLACQTLLSGCQIRAIRLSEKVLSALSSCRALSGPAGFAVRLYIRPKGLRTTRKKTRPRLTVGAPHAPLRAPTRLSAPLSVASSSVKTPTPAAQHC